MLYLEDYLEFIENLPQEFRERLTSMRELDLQVNNEKDRMIRKVSEFFSTIHNVPTDARNTMYDQLDKECKKLLEISEEKITMTNQLHELIVKYHKRLDQELHKFKIELEADNAGITEILEKRALATENSSNNGQAREKRRANASLNDHLNSKPGTLVSERTASANLSNLNLANFPANQPTTFSFDKQGLNLVAQDPFGVAASQAIAATQQLQVGRRTSGMKANYEALNSGFGSTLYNLNAARLDDNFESPNAQNFFKNYNNMDENDRSLKKARSNKRNRASSSINIDLSNNNSNTNSSDAGASFIPEETNEEPRYCLCNNVSYGDMIYCENKSCPYQWFHYNCVNIQVVPEGSWFCPSCSDKKDKKKKE